MVWLLACGIERGCEGIVSFGDEDRGLAVFVLRGKKETSWIVVVVRWRSGVDDGLMFFGQAKRNPGKLDAAPCPWRYSCW